MTNNTYEVSPYGTRIHRSTQMVDKKQALEFEDRFKAELWRVNKLGEKQQRSWQEAVVRWFIVSIIDINQD